MVSYLPLVVHRGSGQRDSRVFALADLCVRTVVQGRVTHLLDGVDKGWIEHVGRDVEAVNGLEGCQRRRDVLSGYIAHCNRPTVDWVDRARRSWPTRSAREGCNAGRLAVISCAYNRVYTVEINSHARTPAPQEQRRQYTQLQGIPCCALAIFFCSSFSFFFSSLRCLTSESKTPWQRTVAAPAARHPPCFAPSRRHHRHRRPRCPIRQ